MILVVLGTQDKPFTRLLKIIESEIKKGNIKDKVVVQAGYTDYESDLMEIHKLIPGPEFEKLIDKADVVITHGGVGSILTSIKKGKKVIACPRLAQYHEHHNDHQKQIINEFSKLGYILEFNDGDDLSDVLNNVKRFKPKKYKSNTKNMIRLLDDYIDEVDNVSWYNKYKEAILYLFFGGCTTLVNIFSFLIFRCFNIDVYVSNIFAWILSVLFAFITNKIFVFESKNASLGKNIYEILSFFACRVLSLLFDMGIMYLMIDVLSCNELISKILSNIFVIIINYVFSKWLIFKK